MCEDKFIVVASRSTNGNWDMERQMWVVCAQELVKKTVSSCDDPLIKKQLGYLLARQGVTLNLEDTAGASMDEDLQMELQEIISNSKLSELYLSLARDLDVMEAKLPEEVRAAVSMQ